ncbi:MAG: tetratricopeptide repeat protein [Thermodesulfobacteriota bacterium]|nr:tetratricopeptide repeat protein [Thermodesulfobacteriota bacterium]
MRQDLEERFVDGQFKFMDNDFDGCIAVFTEVLEADPQCAKVYQARAIACLRLNDTDTAIKDIDAAIKCEPENARLYYHKGGVLFKAELWNEALKCLTQAIDLSPEYAPAYALRSEVYERLGDKDAAGLDINNAMQLRKESTGIVDW